VKGSNPRDRPQCASASPGRPARTARPTALSRTDSSIRAYPHKDATSEATGHHGPWLRQSWHLFLAVSDTVKVREWAKGQGIEVMDRGRVPADVVEQYKTATGA
jgi:hypothetical protein